MELKQTPGNIVASYVPKIYENAKFLNDIVGMDKTFSNNSCVDLNIFYPAY